MDLWCCIYSFLILRKGDIDMLLLKVIFAHCLGDYLFQTEYLAANKGKDNYILLMHSVLYVASVYFIFGSAINMYWYYGLIVSHFIIDYVKARGYSVKWFKGYSNALIVDQALHFILLLMAAIL